MRNTPVLLPETTSHVRQGQVLAALFLCISQLTLSTRAWSAESPKPSTNHQPVQLCDILSWNQEGISGSISSPEEWIRKREAIKQILVHFLGAFPISKVDLNPRILHEEKLDGYNSFFLAAFDDRIKVTVSNCGLTTILGDPNPLRWARKEWFVHIPQLRPYLEVGYASPFDFHEVISLIAPRAFLTISARQDEIFPNWQGAQAAAAEAQKVYSLYKAEEKLKCVITEGKHGFPPDCRAMTYDWIDKWLKMNPSR